ncbi:MAG: photosystem reaction center subunit H [Cyanobacteria bacterium QS_8_64_29]|nr:MAG: photosystem reaction center subunit H [Cyanobacteria bacterium QS_8_64_29]
MTTDPNRLRSEFLNTQVIARDSGRRLGIIRDMLVDIDRREVVALGLCDSLLAFNGTPRYMLLSEIRQAGDVILVDDEEAIQGVDEGRYNRAIGSEVITETGELIGRIRDFQFDLESGQIASLIIASLSYPQIPDSIVSTYELPVDELVSSGPNRIIVFEGAEERLTQLSVGLLERLGIGSPPWEKDEGDLYQTQTARPENQLGTGEPERPPVSQAAEAETVEPLYQDAWAEGDRGEAEPLEREGWADVPAADYQEPEPEPLQQPRKPQYDYDDMETDLWAEEAQSETEEEYQPPRINLPETSKRKSKAPEPEYEEETNY